MKPHKINTIKYYFILVLLFLTEFAQADTGFDDDVDDTTPLPIDDNLFLLAIAGLIFAFYVIKAIEKRKTSSL